MMTPSGQIEKLLDSMGVPIGPPHECSYLPNRMARERAFMLNQSPNGFYRTLMDFGWRRSGMVFYKPVCETCNECRPIRIPVDEFSPSRTQRKLLNRNRDIEGRSCSPTPTEEKFDLFVRYQKSRHTGEMCTEWQEFSDFLYQSPVETREIEFHLDERIVAVAIVDIDGNCLSSVYTYFDPEKVNSSLGTWAILWLIHHAKQLRMTHYYMGYFIRDCVKMNYKSMFQPCEIGDSCGNWLRVDKHGDGVTNCVLNSPHSIINPTIERIQ